MTPDTLPDAAWYAEHIMKKPLHELSEVITVVVGDGEVAQFERAWDPKAHEAHALQLWRRMPNSKALIWDDDQCTIVGAVGEVSATGNPLPLAICAAVYAWWQAQQGATQAARQER